MVPSAPLAPPTVIPPKRTPTPTQPKRKWKGAHTMEPLKAALLDEAWSDESISQVDGAMDTPLERLGSRVEVEGEKLEEEEASMMVWSQVRKRGQVVKNVSAVARGWEEFRSKFPYLGYDLRREWSEREVVKKWLAGGDEGWYVAMEERRKKRVSAARHCEVEEWLRGGGGQE